MNQRTQAVALRLSPPPGFSGTPTQWRVLTESIWPAAKSADSIMLALGYCAARKLDPMRRPVHIVPVWNSTLNRTVETVWPGINELLTTAARSKQFAGVDPPEWGPDQTREFHGEGALTLRFPEWCLVRVWRHVAEGRFAFSVPVYWLESYARAKHTSEAPNAMWAKRAYGQLHKCALAASLRLAFPEDLGADYAAEEMEGQTVREGGVIIDGEPEPHTKEAPPGHPLDERNGTQWVKNLRQALDAAPSLDAVQTIANHPSVDRNLDEKSAAPPMVRESIRKMIFDAQARFEPAEAKGDAEALLFAEIDAMDFVALERLPTNAEWRAKIRDTVGEFPPDQERIWEYAEARRNQLRGGRAEP
jgi:phage recombination protein Bet